jgi:hypothetical protein
MCFQKRSVSRAEFSGCRDFRDFVDLRFCRPSMAFRRGPTCVACIKHNQSHTSLDDGIGVAKEPRRRRLGECHAALVSNAADRSRRISSVTPPLSTRRERHRLDSITDHRERQHSVTTHPGMRSDPQIESAISHAVDQSLDHSARLTSTMPHAARRDGARSNHVPIIRSRVS